MSTTTSGRDPEGQSASPESRGSMSIALIGLLLLVVLIATNMKC